MCIQWKQLRFVPHGVTKLVVVAIRGCRACSRYNTVFANFAPCPVNVTFGPNIVVITGLGVDGKIEISYDSSLMVPGWMRVVGLRHCYVHYC